MRKLLDFLSAPYWMALYMQERATRDEDAALIARLKRENKRLRVRLLEATTASKETTASGM